MLEIQNVSKTFNAGTVNQKIALNGLNLKLNEGDFVTVIGGNGAGKSTMLNAVAGVWPVDEGKILIDGVDVTRLSEHQRAAYIGRVFQDPMTGTAATMQIEENLALAARRGKRRTLRIGITKAEREQYRELLKTLDLGLEDRLTARVGLLSGGQRQALLGQSRGKFAKAGQTPVVQQIAEGRAGSCRECLHCRLRLGGYLPGAGAAGPERQRVGGGLQHRGAVDGAAAASVGVGSSLCGTGAVAGTGARGAFPGGRPAHRAIERLGGLAQHKARGSHLL